MNQKIFYSNLSTETNSFSNIPTSFESFDECGILRGERIFLDESGNVKNGLKTLFETLNRKGFCLTAGLSASAEPGAPTQHADYCRLRDEICDSLRLELPVSAVLLSLHGAMMSTGCPDCEGDLLGQIRNIVGRDTPVVAVLDPHAHLTEQMVSCADFLVFMREYPHVDGAERTQEALEVIFRMLDHSLSLTVAVADCELIGFFPTQEEPMRGFVDRMTFLEEDDDVVSISFIHGFPWGDTRDLGARVLVYTNNNQEKAEALARELSANIWSIKDQTMFETITPGQALRYLGARRNKPVVFGDISDNAGGGAPSDSTFILRELVESAASNVAIGLFYDPEAVRFCHRVGQGGRLRLRIGGKVSEFSGQPVDLDVEVRAVRTNAMMNVADVIEFPMGDTAWVHADGIDIVLISSRVQAYSPDGFSHLGLDLTGLDAVFVKSTNHFQAFFKSLASEIKFVSTPGAINFDFAGIPYRIFDKPYYPRSK